VIVTKRKIIVIVTVTGVFLLVAALFVYSQIRLQQNQISELQNQNNELQDHISELENQISKMQLQNRELQDRLINFTIELANMRHPKVEITGFEWISGFHPIGGLWLGHPVHVTVQNNDVVSFSGIKLWVVLANEKTGAEIATGGITIDRLNAGENRTIYVDGMYGPWTSLGTSLEGAVCVVTLEVDGITLDSETYSIS
jgi:hypothetical protein